MGNLPLPLHPASSPPWPSRLEYWVDTPVERVQPLVEELSAPASAETQLVDQLNARFHRSPFGPDLWAASGALAEAGLLIHSFDGWEDHQARYLPGANGKDQCGEAACR
jgi:hypothetical protein